MEEKMKELNKEQLEMVAGGGGIKPLKNTGSSDPAEMPAAW